MIELNEKIISEIKDYAFSSPKREVCGLITSSHRRMKFFPCKNIAERDEDFVICPFDYSNIEDNNEVVCVFHSHVNVSSKPSQADLVSIERSGLPWLIMNVPNGDYTLNYPNGYSAPYVGRKFVHNVLDCYTIWRDYYKNEFGIVMREYFREENWWLKGQDLYEDNYKSEGFVEVNDLKKHDVLLMKIASPKINHAAVYLGDNVILQHLMGKISSRDVYGGWYRKMTVKVLRHESLL